MRHCVTLFQLKGINSLIYSSSFSNEKNKYCTQITMLQKKIFRVFYFTPSGHSTTYYAILETGWLPKQIKNTRCRIQIRNPEILVPKFSLQW